MNGPVILDTGPLVAYLKRRDRFHAWSRQEFLSIEAPLCTCEAVLTEACYLMRDRPGGQESVLDLLVRRIFCVSFSLDEHGDDVSKLMARYANVTMSLADACLVRMAELLPHSAVLTIDTDFRFYRKHGRLVVPTRMPAGI